MNVFKMLGFATAIALPFTIMAQSSKLNSEPSTQTPAHAHSSKQNTSSGSAEQETSQSLSQKNRKVYSTLSPEDKKKVDEAAKRGRDPQKKMMEILNYDQKTSKRKSKGQGDNGFIWENDQNQTPASKHANQQRRSNS